MKEELITFETAKLAKEKGFDEVCSYLYENSKEIVYTTHKNSGLNKHFDWYSAPSQSLLQRWMREKYNIHIEITWNPNETDKHYYASLNYIVGAHNKDTLNEAITYITYEEALEVGLYEALKLI